MIYDKAEESYVLEIESFLKTDSFRNQLKRMNLKDCNLWLPFDFHLYEAGLHLRPGKSNLKEEDIHDLALHEFSFLANYFGENGMENLEKIISNKGYQFEQLQSKLQEKGIFYEDSLLFQIINGDISQIQNKEEQKIVLPIQKEVRKQFIEHLEKDRNQKIALGNQVCLLIVSKCTQDVITNLEDIVFSRTCYFIEEKSNQTIQNSINRKEMIKQLGNDKSFLETFIHLNFPSLMKPEKENSYIVKRKLPYYRGNVQPKQIGE